MNRAIQVLCGGFLCLFLVGMLVTPASAGDNTATSELIINETDVESGEAVLATIEFFSDGGYGGEGVVELRVTMQYNSSVLDVESVTAGSFFESDGADADLTVTDEDGELRVEKRRVPDDKGTTGYEPIVHVTFAVGEDVGPEHTELAIDSISATLVDDIPVNTYTLNAEQTLAIDGGVGADGGDADDGDTAVGDDGDPAGVTLADDPPDDSPNTDETAADTDSTESDGLPGAIPAIAGIAVAVALLAVVVVVGRHLVGDHNP